MKLSRRSRQRTKLTLALSAATVVVAFASIAISATAQYAEMAQLREHVRAGRWDDVVAGAQEFLRRDDLSAALRNGAIELVARGQLAGGDESAAADTLLMLYARDPNHQPGPDVSAEERRAFLRARQANPETVHVDLLHQPAGLDRRRAPRVDARLSGAANTVAEVVIMHRRDSGDYERLAVTPSHDGTVEARLPLASGGEGYTAQYYLEARAPSGAVLDRLATAVQPLEVVVPGGVEPLETEGDTGVPDSGPDADREEESGGVFGQWWFWTLTAAVLAGGAVAAYFLFVDSGADDGSLGSVELLRFP